ncbi:MAG: hypothetical protein IH950_14910 [Bacteroidetes bacterium]|nr:hypothetical protein [Bacteroidota bacterium]
MSGTERMISKALDPTPESHQKVEFNLNDGICGHTPGAGSQAGDHPRLFRNKRSE